MIRIFFLSQSSPILELFPFDKITLKSYICTVVTVMAKQCWSQTVLESGSWGHSVLQTPALVVIFSLSFSTYLQYVKHKTNYKNIAKFQKTFKNAKIIENDSEFQINYNFRNIEQFHNLVKHC